MRKELYLLRGLPTSGKSTLAKSLGGEHYEADSYFMVHKDPKTGEVINRHQHDGVYEFDPSKIKLAHESCQDGVEDAMSCEYERIVVSNTFTQEWEMKPYYEMAEKNGYMVFSLIVEKRHEGVNEHNVPEETLDKMEDRFEIKLR